MLYVFLSLLHMTDLCPMSCLSVAYLSGYNLYLIIVVFMLSNASYHTIPDNQSNQPPMSYFNVYF